MKRMFTVGLVTLGMLIGLATPKVSHAEPNPAVQWLINEPASVFDIGMIYLDSFLKRRLANDGHAFAIYDWKKNRISITATKEIKNPDELKKTCKLFLGYLRAIGGVYNGKTKSNLSSVFSVMFSHIGYQSSNQPKDLWVKLDNIFDLTVEISAKGKTVICTGPLLSEDVFFLEK